MVEQATLEGWSMASTWFTNAVLPQVICGSPECSFEDYLLAEAFNIYFAENRKRLIYLSVKIYSHGKV
jgi:hypothetical protein